jgi:hypothetical protein
MQAITSLTMGTKTMGTKTMGTKTMGQARPEAP